MGKDWLDSVAWWGRVWEQLQVRIQHKWLNIIRSENNEIIIGMNNFWSGKIRRPWIWTLVRRIPAFLSPSSSSSLALTSFSASLSSSTLTLLSIWMSVRRWNWWQTETWRWDCLCLFWNITPEIFKELSFISAECLGANPVSFVWPALYEEMQFYNLFQPKD